MGSRAREGRTSPTHRLSWGEYKALMDGFPWPPPLVPTHLVLYSSVAGG